MSWKHKGLLQLILSAIPCGCKINDLMQIKCGALRCLDATVKSKFTDDWLVLVSHMQELKRPLGGLVYLEIGTGWLPILPACFSLAGAKKCLTFDIKPHMNSKLTFLMLKELRNYIPAIAEVSARSVADVENDLVRLAEARGLKQLLSQAEIEYHAPADAAATGLVPESVDIVFSNSVLEHAPAEIILKLMKESYRVLRKNGFVMHSVNCGDHYAYFDKKISPINYLRYSEKEWRIWNNSLQYQNRLRPVDFIKLAEQAGFEIILCKHKPNPDLLSKFPGLKINKEFECYSADQLCSTSVDFIGLKK